jgi:hypothetical protein
MSVAIRIALFVASFVLLTQFPANPLTPTQNIGLLCGYFAFNGLPGKKGS